MSVIKNTDVRAILDIFEKYGEANRLMLLDLVSKELNGEDTGLWPESEATRNEVMSDDEAAEMHRRASYIQTAVLFEGGVR